MNDNLRKLLDELLQNPALSLQEFARDIQLAIASGARIDMPSPDSREKLTFLHELADTAPERADLILEACTADPEANINVTDIYGQTFGEKLASGMKWDTIRELIDSDTPIFIDTPVSRVSGAESIYRQAIKSAPMSTVRALEEYAQRMDDRGITSVELYRDRVDRFGETVLHGLASRSDLNARDFKQYLDMTASDIQGGALKSLLEARGRNGENFFNRIVSRDPQVALEVHRMLKDELAPAEYDAAAILGGDAERPLSDRHFTLPENTVPALQLAENSSPEAEQLMMEIINEVGASKLHCQASNGHTPLSIMAKHGWIEGIVRAVEQGLDINYGADGFAKNPLNEAMNNTARPDVSYITVKRLVGWDIDSRWLEPARFSDASVVGFAVDHGDPDLLWNALMKGADPNGHPAADRSPIRSAIENFSKDTEAYEVIMRRLILSGASLKKLDSDMLSPSDRLQNPEMAAARDYVHRLATINGLKDRYGYQFAELAVDGLSQPQGQLAKPEVSLGTLQMIPGVTRALSDAVALESTGHDRVASMLKVNPQHDPDVNVQDLVNMSRTLLKVPEVNRQNMLVELDKLRAGLTNLSPQQVSPEALTKYQNQVMSVNRVHNWVRDSLTHSDNMMDAGILMGEHGRYLERSLRDLADVAAASPLMLNPAASEFPLTMSVDGKWNAEVTIAGDQNPAPVPNKPASFLFAQRNEGNAFSSARMHNAQPTDKPIAYISDITMGNDIPQDLTAGYIKFDNPSVVHVENSLMNGFDVDVGLMRDMGHDGVLVYDSTRNSVVGAIDLGGQRMEFPNGVTVESSPAAQVEEPEMELKSNEPQRRSPGL
ncbi:hypothetical protein [Marinobacter sp.]|uniref:hypothetical protein n=1 Tax=Marinobacter sp. TaxID=50741 RepID=UPI003567FE94